MDTMEEINNIFIAASERERRAKTLAILYFAIPFLAGCLFLYYALAKVGELETRQEALQKNIGQAQREYAALKLNIEKLYSVRVTSENGVYELKATALATGRNLNHGSEYKFTIFINSPSETLSTISRVLYEFRHPTFTEQQQYASNSKDRFSTSYVGWGCLTSVQVTVELKDGAKHAFDFNMCKSLGPQWELH